MRATKLITLDGLTAVLLAGIFIVSGGEKIMNPNPFAEALGEYRLLPDWSVTGFAIVLPWWEMSTGAVLLWPAWRKTGALLVSALSLAFLTAVVSAWWRGLDIACGCFGDHSARIGIQTVWLDVGLLAAGIFLLVHSRKIK